MTDRNRTSHPPRPPRRPALWVCAGILLLGAALADPPPRVTAYVGATLIDGTGAEARPDTVLIVRGDRIEAVGERGRLPIPAGAAIVRLDGRYVIPGLINAHVHVATEANPPEARAYLRRELYSGVTAVRDMAGDARLLAELKREAAAGEIESPDLYYAALMAGPGFFDDPRTHQAARGLTAGAVPWMRAVDPTTNLVLAVAEARGTGASAIKIYADLPAPLVAAITAEAHRQGLLVWAHAAVFPAGPRAVVEAGVDVMSHAGLFAYELREPVPSHYADKVPFDASFVERVGALDPVFATMKAHGTVLDATLYVTRRYPATRYPAALPEAIAREAHRVGVMLCAGTDDDPDWREADSAIVDELGYLVSAAGLTPSEALRASSLGGARALGLEADLGTLEPGKLASFVVLRRDTSRDIGNVRSVERIVKRGIGYVRSRYRPYAPPQRGPRSSS